MAAPLANIFGLLKTHRYNVLAGTMLAVLAVPQWNAVSDTARAGAILGTDGTIILAQQETPEQRRLREQKGKQPPAQKAPPQKGPPTPGPGAGKPPVTQQTTPQVTTTPNTGPKGPGNQPAVLEKNIKPKDAPKNAPVVGTPGRVGGTWPVVGTPGRVGGTGPVVNQPPAVTTGPGRIGGGRVGGPPVVVGRPGPTPVNVENLRDLRRERRDPSGRIIVEEPGGRAIIRDRGLVFIRHDEGLRFARFGAPVVTRRGLETFNVVRRPGGFEVITVSDANGNVLRRIRRGPDGREFVLFNNRPRVGPLLLGAGLVLGLAAPAITIPRERYIVDVGAAPPALLYDTLMAPPLMAMERPYTLDEIRYNEPLRARMPRLDIDTLTFATGSWEVTPDQAQALEGIAQAILAVIAKDPNEVFMIEGHTDAVGNPDDNLSLSDRRAESVAVILTETYMIPPENLVTQGYGAQFLKIPTQDAERQNRRVAVRRITPLLGQVAQQ